MKQLLLLITCFILAAGNVHATTVTHSGKLNDPANAALFYSDLTPAQFGSDADIANNVALYSLSVATPSSVSFVSSGNGKGGIDPYFTLFQGSGNGATFFASNYDQAFSTGGDFSLSYLLAAGDYMVALGTFANMSFAENNGYGSLGDGFIKLGTETWLGDSYYELAITTSEQPSAPVPEPSTILLSGAGLLALLALRKKSKA